MATITTVTPTVTTRPHIPGSPGDRSLAGEVDLATRESWSYVSSFVVGGLELTFNSGGPTADIAQGRIARARPEADPPQELVTVGAVSGVSLASSSTNYIYFKENNDIEVRDADNPPSADALLVGTVDTSAGSVTEAVRGRSPISQFAAVGTGGSTGGTANGAAALQSSGTNQSVPDSTKTIISLDTVDFDALSAVDLSGNQITIQNDGLFIITADLQIDDAPAEAQMGIFVEADGVIIIDDDAGNPDTVKHTIGATLAKVDRLSAGTNLQLRVTQFSGTSLTVAGGENGGHLAIARIGD